MRATQSTLPMEYWFSRRRVGGSVGSAAVSERRGGLLFVLSDLFYF